MQNIFSSRAILGVAIAGIVLVLGILLYLGFTLIQSERTSQEAPQQDLPRVGILIYIDQIIDFIEGFEEGMGELGYVEGKNILYQFERSQMDIGVGIFQNPFALDSYARQLVEDDVDVIYAVDITAVQAAQRAMDETGKTIPIVFVFIEDPIEEGLVASIESSGNHLTGIAASTPVSAEVEARKLAFLKQINPDFQRLGLFTDGFMVDVPGAPGPPFVEELKRQAALEGIEIVEYTTDMPPGPGLEEELQRVISQIQPGDIDAGYHIPGHYVEFSEDYEAQMTVDFGIPYVLASLADERRLRDMELGGTFAYYTDRFFIGKQAARMVDKILQGTPPSNIPIEFPEKTTLYINLDVAERQGVEIPDSMLLIADEIYQSAE